MRLAAHEMEDLRELILSCCNTITNMGYFLHHVKDPELAGIIRRHYPLHVQDYNLKVQYVSMPDGPNQRLSVPPLTAGQYRGQYVDQPNVTGTAFGHQYDNSQYGGTQFSGNQLGGTPVGGAQFGGTLQGEFQYGSTQRGGTQYRDDQDRNFTDIQDRGYTDEQGTGETGNRGNQTGDRRGLGMEVGQFANVAGSMGAQNIGPGNIDTHSMGSFSLTPRTNVREFTDHEIATAYLLTLKRAGREYAWAAMETTNPELRLLLEDAFTMSSHHAYEVWQWMHRQGYYPIFDAPRQEIQTMSQMFGTVQNPVTRQAQW